MALALSPTASTSRLPPRATTATTDGSSMMMPRPDHVHQRIGRAEVDGDVVGERAREHGVNALARLRTDAGARLPFALSGVRQPLRIIIYARTLDHPRAAANRSHGRLLETVLARCASPRLTATR